MMRRGRKRYSEKGVTLIELVVVMAIIAIMAVFMIPSIGEWAQNYRIKQAARNLASDLQSCKMQAVSMGRYCVVAFNANGYVIFPDYDNDMVLDTANIGDIDSDGVQENETTDIFKTVVFSNAYRTVTFDTACGDGNDGISFTNNMVAFDGRGLPRNNTGGYAGGIVFLINTANNKARSIAVSNAGAITITEYQ